MLEALDVDEGGAVWLPYAQSLLRTLKVTLNQIGIDFGRKQYLTPDGNGYIIIRTRRGPGTRDTQAVAFSPDARPDTWLDSIRIESSGKSIMMDSGVVELRANSVDDPNIWLPGVLHESSGVKAYNALFVPTTPTTGWRKNPDPSNTGQVSGTLGLKTTAKGINIKGRVPYDLRTAASFHPKTIADTSTTPEGLKDDPADIALAAKKVLAATCPASIFTGRTRLYVQAMYGEPSYRQNKTDKDGNSTAEGLATPTLSLFDGFGGTPALNVPAYRHKGDKTDYADVVLTTGTGLFLDPKTGKHWLFATGADGVVVYPLIAEALGESLRKLLVTLPPPADALNALDTEHLEAYVLSTCRPDVKNLQWLPFGATLNTWSLGYSWHWNWTGLVADIVTNEEFSQGHFGANEFFGMRSTHRRITMTQPSAGVFAAAVSVVEGPSDWAVDRVLWCIAEPDWGAGDLTKTTPKYSNIFACDAPFYAFYIRDTLKVCRVHVEEFAGADSTRVTSDGFGTPAVMNTVGILGGFGEDQYATPTYWEATFTCDDITLSNLFAYRAENGLRDDISAKSIASVSAPSFAGYEPVYYVDIESGYPLVGGPPDFAVTHYDAYDPGSAPGTYIYGMAKNTNLIPTFNYTWINSAHSKQWRGGAIIAVPWMDAEAVFMYDNPSVVESFTGQQSHACTNTEFGRGSSWYTAYYLDYVFSATAWADTVLRYFGAASGTPIDGTITYPPDVVTTTPIETQSVLICHAGAVPADITHGDFSHYNNFTYDDVGDDLKTLSGTSAASPVVISPGRIAAVGIDFVPVVPALVGWV